MGWTYRQPPPHHTYQGAGPRRAGGYRHDTLYRGRSRNRPAWRRLRRADGSAGGSLTRPTRGVCADRVGVAGRARRPTGVRGRWEGGGNVSRIRCVRMTGGAGSGRLLVWRGVRVTVCEIPGAGSAGEAGEPQPFRFVPREEGPAARWLRAERAREVYGAAARAGVRPSPWPGGQPDRHDDQGRRQHANHDPADDELGR
jgi:hypothetical protein